MKNYSYPIDYDDFEIEEISIIVNLLRTIEDINEGKKVYNVKKNYNDFKCVLNSKTLEKQMDKDFERLSGYSIYNTIKEYNNDN